MRVVHSACMALSTTERHIRGATTLIMAISGAATLFPTVSIIWAALRVSSLACSISSLERAMSCWMVPCATRGFPKATLL